MVANVNARPRRPTAAAARAIPADLQDPSLAGGVEAARTAAAAAHEEAGKLLQDVIDAPRLERDDEGPPARRA